MAPERYQRNRFLSGEQLMHRKLGVIALASALLLAGSGSTFAAGTDQSALAPGKPAGVRQAALHAPLWVWIAGVGFVALGVGLVLSGNSNGTSGGSSTSTHL
jgi:hypothetical protein